MLEKRTFRTKGREFWLELTTNFEYMAQATPQRHSLVELGFASHAWLSQAMFSDANMDADCQIQLAKECRSLANKYCNLAVIKYQDKQMTRFEAAGLGIQSWIAILKACGEAGVVETDKNYKFGDRGVTCVFVNYPYNESSDCFWMFKLKTGRIIESRDIQWLNWMYYSNDPSDQASQKLPCTVLMNPSQWKTKYLSPIMKQLKMMMQSRELHQILLHSTEHEAGNGNDSNEERIMSAETKTSTQELIQTQRGWKIKRPTYYINEDFKTNLMNYYNKWIKSLNSTSKWMAFFKLWVQQKHFLADRKQLCLHGPF